MARLGRGGFLVLAAVFHFVYIFSIFDIYFVSPIVHGMQAHRVVQDKAPAKRLVLYVGDGLRADKAFQSFPNPSTADPTEADLAPRPLAPFLRSKVLEDGTFGMSHTRVPTESRPGHVALIAGLYEDVSAVTTGWKLNPVDFDSVFNRSRHTWSWGSPDILPMFSEGAVPGRVDADCYPAEFEDFSGDALALDIWVFDKVKAMFEEAKTNSTLNSMLHEDKLVFFLHLLGLDTTGHFFRPYSNKYLHNIKVVDQGVKEITKLIDDFYGDENTAYVFTADHGMSDWGSHGDGHPDNTRTPLVVWGSGVAKPNVFTNGKAPGHEDGVSHDWNLDHIQRHDVAQADVAALMAYLVGIEFPVNSVGELPLSYLDASSQEKAAAAMVNTREVLEMYKVKEAEKKSTAMQYKPYPQFVKTNGSVDERLNEVERAISAGQHDTAIQLSYALLQDAIQGLRYLQTYDWLFLRALITLGYLGWIAYAFTTVIDLHVTQGNALAKRTTATNAAFSSVLVLLYASFLVERSPIAYYAYAFFPVFFWEEVFARREGVMSGIRLLLAQHAQTSSYATLGFQLAAFLIIVEALVQSYFHRVIFTICYGLAAFWPSFYGAEFVAKNSKILLAWAAGCLALSTFTLLPVIKAENANTITMGGLLMLVGGLGYLALEDQITSQSRSGTANRQASLLSRILMGVQLGVLLLTIVVTHSSVLSMQAGKGLPLGNQVTSWVCLLSSVALPFMHKFSPNNHYLHRLMVIFLAFAPCFVLLTVSYEGLFYFTFGATLLTWVRLEHAIYIFHGGSKAESAQHNGTVITSTASSNTDITPRTTYRTLTLADFRTSLFFFFLLQSAFFSTGNIASVSSFSLDAVSRLVPVFDPFSQGALLTYKLMVPFALISAALGILNRRVGLQSSALFMVVMAFSDIMTLNFFWTVRDEGSWLEIGTTISHFVIASLIGVFVAALEGLSEVLIRGVDVGEDGFEEQTRQKGEEIVGNGTVKVKSK
jgi:GPI ethanolamine phosphate transferase 1